MEPILKNLLTLLSAMTVIATVSTDLSITSCPEQCNCQPVYGRASADCSQQNLVDIPEGLSDQTEVLDLSHNRFSDLIDDYFRDMDLIEVEFLYLSNNEIDDITVDAFRGLKRLIVLDLSHNKIRSLRLQTFNHNKKLQTLYLGANPLKIHSDNSLHFNIPSLTTLDLASSGLKYIPDSAFTEMREIVSLNLSGNNLTYLDPDVLAPFEHLKILDVSGNYFTCDCDTWTLYSWLKESSILLEPSLTCVEKGAGIRRLVTELDGKLCKALSYKKRINQGLIDDESLNAVKVPNTEDSYFWPIVGGVLTALTLFFILLSAYLVISWHDRQRRNRIPRDGDFEEHTRVLLTPDARKVFFKIKKCRITPNINFRTPPAVYRGDISPYVHHTKFLTNSDLSISTTDSESCHIELRN